MPENRQENRHRSRLQRGLTGLPLTPATSRSVFDAELRNLQFLEDSVLLKRHRNRSRHNWIVELLKHRIQELVDLPLAQDLVPPDVVGMAVFLVLQPNVGVRV